MARAASGIHICRDNFGVARNAGGISKNSSQKAFCQFRDLAEGWLQTNKEQTVQWVSSHVGIDGNKSANHEAKKYAK